MKIFSHLAALTDIENVLALTEEVGIVPMYNVITRVPDRKLPGCQIVKVAPGSGYQEMSCERG